MKCAAPSGAASFWGQACTSSKTCLGRTPGRISTFTVKFLYLLRGRCLWRSWRANGKPAIRSSSIQQVEHSDRRVGKNAPCCHRDDAPPIEQGRSGLEETEDV